MQEILDKRGWDSKTFDTGRTEWNRPVYATRIQNGLHDRNPDGTFDEIVTDLDAWENGVHSHKARRTRCGMVAVSDYTSPNRHLAEITTKAGNGISIKLVSGTNPVYGPFNDSINKTRYNYDAQNIRVEQTVRYNGISIVLIIQNPLTASPTYRFSLKDKGCAYTYEMAGPDILCKSSTGADDILIKCMPAEDAAGSLGDVTLSIVGEQGGYMIIEKAVDEAWLRQAVGPVKVDPTVIISGTTAILDTFCESANPTTNNGASTATSVLPTRTSQWWANVTSLPVNALILSGHWNTEAFGTAFPATNIYLNSLLVDFVEMEATWQIRKTGVPWNTPGGLGAGTDYNTTDESGPHSIPATAVVELPVRASTIQSWLDTPATNYGILVRTTAGAGGCNFRSSEAAANQLALHVEYVLRGSRIFFFGDDE